MAGDHAVGGAGADFAGGVVVDDEVERARPRATDRQPQGGFPAGGGGFFRRSRQTAWPGRATARPSRARGKGFLVEGDEAFEKRGQDVVIDAAAGEMRIEGLDFSAVSNVKNFRAVAERDGRLPASAAGDAQERES